MSAPPRRAPTPPPPPSPPRRRARPGRFVGAAVLGLLVAVFALPDLLFGLDRRSPFAQLVAFRPWVLVGGAAFLLLLVVVTVARRRAWPYPVAVLVVLLIGTGLVVPRLVADPVPTGGPTLKVLSFNTYVGNADVDALAALIDQERPDLVSLSEAGGRYVSRLAPRVEPLGYQLHTSVGERRSDVAGMTAVVSDAFGDVDVHYGEDDMPFPYVEVSGGDLGELRFVAFHSVAPVRGSVPEWAADLDRVPQWCGSGGPAVIAGDFNATLDHSALRAGMAGCADAADQRGAGLVPTWGPSPRTRLIGPQIDHVLASDGIVARDFAVRDVPGSDHRAVLTTLVLPR